MTLADWRARWSVAFAAPATAPAAPALLAGRTVAVARDAAFAFVYPANLECLQALGARVAFFSPLAGDALPACDALWLPGGYPELHASALAARTDLRAQLQAHAQAGRPVWAECGGMMCLFDELLTRDGAVHPMWGLLPGRVRMQGRLMGLPSKPAERLELLRLLAARVLRPGEVVAEKELNLRLAAFDDDVASLRRLMVEAELLERTPTGTEYALVAPEPTTAG